MKLRTGISFIPPPVCGDLTESTALPYNQTSDLKLEGIAAQCFVPLCGQIAGMDDATQGTLDIGVTYLRILFTRTTCVYGEPGIFHVLLQAGHVENPSALPLAEDGMDNLEKSMPGYDQLDHKSSRLPHV
jgi:hypothetical protein